MGEVRGGLGMDGDWGMGEGWAGAWCWCCWNWTPPAGAKPPAKEDGKYSVVALEEI